MADQAGITIALVDDGLPLRRLVSFYLAAHGFNVVYEADNGQQLLTALANAKTLPDMCLLDTNMPVMDGYRTARLLKAGYPSIKIMGYSFFDSYQSSSTLLKCGAHDFISKDASAEELRDALISLFNAPEVHEYATADDLQHDALSASDHA